MQWYWIVLIVLGVLVLAFVIFMMTFGRKLQKQQAEAEKQMELNKRTEMILVIDKQKKKMTESGLPNSVIQQTPKYMRRMKMPIVKAKVGNQIMILVADNDVFEILPVKKTCTVSMSGIYITELKAVRGGSVPKIQKKKGWFARLKEKVAGAAKK
ncbi:MAG: hypothetical protein J6Z23_06530 [Lachnospiraceae bacterium]|nr:hypothetical protein [Lachnospiraceae bacterium]MBP5255015.1 hypothetical protein [Lachnospiraceae bacterium]